jgi:hypothetical protein
MVPSNEERIMTTQTTSPELAGTREAAAATRLLVLPGDGIGPEIVATKAIGSKLAGSPQRLGALRAPFLAAETRSVRLSLGILKKAPAETRALSSEMTAQRPTAWLTISDSNFGVRRENSSV